MTDYKILTPEEIREIFPTQGHLILQDQEALKQTSALVSIANQAIDAMITELRRQSRHPE